MIKQHNLNDKTTKLSSVFGGQVRITGGAIFPTGGANAPLVKELKNALCLLQELWSTPLVATVAYFFAKRSKLCLFYWPNTKILDLLRPVHTGSRNRILCIRKQATLFSATKYPVSGYRVSWFGNQCGQAFTNIWVAYKDTYEACTIG